MKGWVSTWRRNQRVYGSLRWPKGEYFLGGVRIQNPRPDILAILRRHRRAIEEMGLTVDQVGERMMERCAKETHKA